MTDEVRRQILDVGGYVFTEMGKEKAREIARDGMESLLAREMKQ